MKDTRRQRVTYIDAEYTAAPEQIIVYRPPPARKQRVAQHGQSWGRAFNLLLFLIAALGVLVMLWFVWPTPATVEQPAPLPTASVKVNPLDVTVRDPALPPLVHTAYQPAPQPLEQREPMPAPPPVFIPNDAPPVANVAPPVSAEPPQVEQVVAPVDAAPPVSVPEQPAAVEPNALPPREVAAPNPASLERVPVAAVEGTAHHGMRPTVVACQTCHEPPACTTCKPVPSGLKEAK